MCSNFQPPRCNTLENKVGVNLLIDLYNNTVEGMAFRPGGGFGDVLVWVILSCLDLFWGVFEEF